MNAVAKARLRLLSALIHEATVDAERSDPSVVAAEARTLLDTPLARCIDTDAEELCESTQLDLRHLQGELYLHPEWSSTPLTRAWDDYVLRYHQYFEPDLRSRMDRFFALIHAATKIVQRQALEALGDPKNWPFDPDLSPAHETNVEAAKAHSVTYNPELRQYIDEDGCPRFDAYGQPL